jgi:histone H3/H4
MSQEEKKEEKEASYITKSSVREFFKQKNKRVAEDALEALNKQVEALLAKAAERAEMNKRVTIQPQDF